MKTYSLNRILFYLFLFLIFIGIIMIIIISVFIYRLNVDEAIRHYKSVLETTSNTVSSSFWIHQELTHIPGTVENFLYQSAKTPGIIFIRILNSDEKTVEKSSDKKEIKMKINNPPVFSKEIIVRDGKYKNKSIKELSVKSSGGDNLWIGASLDIQKRNAFFYSVLFGELLIILFGITAITIFLILRKFIIIPFLLFIKAFEKLKNKDYNKAILSSQNFISYEIDGVFHSFNDAVEELRLSEEKLKKSAWENIKKLENKIKVSEEEIYELKKTRDNLESKLRSFL